VAVLAAFSPAADVDVPDAGDTRDGRVDPQEQRPELVRELLVEIREVDVALVMSRTTTGSPDGSERPDTNQFSSDQRASVSVQWLQPSPPAPYRAGSSATGGSSARGVSSPSNGHVSHSSTGGVRSAPFARSQNSSGVSGTARS
jgi:predicted RNA-binding Zn ribbon-like protein